MWSVSANSILSLIHAFVLPRMPWYCYWKPWIIHYWNTRLNPIFHDLEIVGLKFRQIIGYSVPVAMVEFVVDMLTGMFHNDAFGDPSPCRDQFSQWNMSLQCNDVSLWLGAYICWSLTLCDAHRTTSACSYRVSCTCPFLCRYYSISQEICTRFLLCCALLWLYIDWFSHIHQAYFAGAVAI